MEQALAHVNGWLPEEWRWFRESRRPLRGECCGVLGGKRLDFIRYVAGQAFGIIESGINGTTLAHISDKASLMVLLEQFLLAACVEYHQEARSRSPFRGITIAYLFSSGADAFNPEQAARIGYTHLLGGTKRNPAVMRLLEERIVRDDPRQYKRCREYLRA